MSCTGSVRGFSEFDDLCRGHQGYSTNLAELFDKCDMERSHRHSINFKEALKRLKNKIKDTFQELELHTEREIKEFTIGKTFVKSRTGVTFNTMKATTWSLGGGINGRWQDYKKEDYDGLVVIGCIERDTIPENVKETNKFFEINQQTYALGLEQALIQHFILHKPDERIRNRSFDPGNLSSTIYKGGIVYVAYKLAPEASYSDDEVGLNVGTENVNVVIQEQQTAMNRLKLRLEKEGLFFKDGIPLEGASFFEACSSQMERVGIPCMDHNELRRTVIQQLKLFPSDTVCSANFTKERWNQYLEKLGNGSDTVEDIEDIVLDKMAQMLNRQIIMYFTEYPDRIGSTSINDQASNNGTPLLLGKHKFYFQSLCSLTEKEHISTQEVNPEKTGNNKRPPTVSFDNGATPIKIRRFSGETIDNLVKREPSFHSLNPSQNYAPTGIAAPEQSGISQSNTSTPEKPKPIIKKERTYAAEQGNVHPSSTTIQEGHKSRSRNETDQKNIAGNVSEQVPYNQIPLPLYSSSSVSDQPEAINNGTKVTSPLTPFITEQPEHQGMNTECTTTPPKKGSAIKYVRVVKEEMKLILNSYIQQRIKSDWKVLVDTVYSQRYKELPSEIINHYDSLLPHQRKDRIKRFINDCKNGKRNEKDPEIAALIAEIKNTS